jgi:hypothetical protein
MEGIRASDLESVMSQSEPSGSEPIKANLRKALERLRDDIDRVEFWANALEGLTHPVPDYQASDRLARHLLPHARAGAREKANH